MFTVNTVSYQSTVTCFFYCRVFQNRVAEKDPKTIAEFKEILVDCWWKDISQEYIQRLYHSMPRRIAEMLGVDGKMTKY